MIKILRIYLFVASLILVGAFSANAQNCTINAGQDRVICPGTSFILTGAATGSFAETAVWTQIAGPAVTISTTTVAGGAATATVSGYLQNVDYTFRLTAKCTDGSPVFDDAIYKASDLTVANLGPDRVECPGTITLVGNPLKPGETALWEVISGNLPVPSPATSASASVTLPTSGNSVGVTVFRYTIKNGSTNCTSSDLIEVRNLGGVFPVTAVSPLNASCYTLTASKQLSASYGGAGFGQQGTWSFISGPSTPSFANIHDNNTTVSNLSQGTYVVRWTVVGPCSTGSADVTINVDPPSQDVTPAGSPTMIYCDGRTTTILNGVKPLYTNETVQWTAAAGNPAGATIHSPTSATTTITGLNGSSNYNFNYTITNTVTGCSSSGTYSIRYTVPPAISITPTSPQILACEVGQLAVPYTISGGNLTQWALISGPSDSQIAADHPFGVYMTAASSIQNIIGLDKIGTYVVRFRRTSDNSSGGCVDAYADLSIVVSKTPYQAVGGTNQFLVCGTVNATLAGNAAQVGDSGSGQWSQVSGPNTAVIANKFLNTTAISNLVSGVYIFRWIVTGGAGCPNTQDDARVIVASQPTVVNAGASINACFGTPIKLDANVPERSETGTWTVFSQSPAAPASTISFSNVNDPKATATGFLANKTYVLRWTISNACGSIFNDVTINTDNTNGPKQAIAGANMCFTAATTNFNLAGNAPAVGETGTWTLLPGAPNVPTFNASLFNTAVSGATVGTYTFEWKLERGSCVPTRDTVVVTIAGPTTVATITGAPQQNVCSLAPLSLLANQPAANETGLWTQVEGPGGAVINNPTSYNTANVTGLIEARYKFRWTISNSACSSSSAEITYNIGEPPTTANAGTNQTLCDVTTATLAANVITTGTGLWSVVSGPSTPVFANVSSPTSTISNLELGTYVLTWKATNGPYCAPSTSNVTITIGQSAKAGADQTLCNVTSTVLIGNDGSTGTWTQTAGPAVTITPNSNNTAIVTGLTAGGNYTFQYAITVGGCGTATDLMNVTVSGPPSTADAGPDQEICTTSGTTANITAVAPVIGTGAWSFLSQPSGGVATIASSTTPATTVNNLSVPGVYILRWTVSNVNCSGTQSNNDVVRITVYLPPTTAQPMPAQTSACQGGVTLTGTTPVIGVGTWTYVSGGTNPGNIVINAPNSPTTTISGLDVAPGNPYIFKWTIANGVCASSSQNVSVNVVDVSPSQANAGVDAEVCTAAIGGTGTKTLTATAVVGGTGTWSVVSGPNSPTFSSFNDPVANVSNLIKGTYILKWKITNTSGCTTEDQVSLVVFDPPSVADAGDATASFCLYAPVQLAAVAPTSGIGTWTTFSKPAGSVNPVFSSVNANNATVGGLELGTYVFRWTTSNGPCTTYQDDITVTIQDCQVAIAKSAGTPVQQANGSYNVTFTFKVKNTGTTALSTVQVKDQLNLTFPSPKTFTKVSLNATGSLTANPTFNGTADQNLLTPASSALAAGQEETITLVVNVIL